MPTGHGDGRGICRREDRSRRRQPCSFLRCSEERARRPFLLRHWPAPRRDRSEISATQKTRELRGSNYASSFSPPRLEIRKPEFSTQKKLSSLAPSLATANNDPLHGISRSCRSRSNRSKKDRSLS